MGESCHVAVMCAEVLEFLRAREGGTFLDCTFGGAGHTSAILAANSANRVVALDRDERAISRGRELAAQFGERLRLVKSDFATFCLGLAGEKFNGVLADLGLSSDQLAERRGFSFDDDAQLDMRMDEAQHSTAESLVNSLSERDLRRIFKQGGAEQEANAAARVIVNNRPIKSAKQLAELLAANLRAKAAIKKTNPATVVFQALRIAVNEELQQLQTLLDCAPTLVEHGGRLIVISFHSLEDKIVTRKMRAWASPSFSAMWPGSQSSKSLGRMLTKRALSAGASELELNNRARSARLRCFEFN